MKSQGYIVNTNPRRKYRTIRSVSSEKSVRMYRLGNKYTNEAILRRIKVHYQQYGYMKEKMMYEMTINNILNPLLEIVYEYKASNAYNYVPGTSEDSKAGWDYYGNKFKAIFKALNANIFLNKEQYNCIWLLKENNNEHRYFTRTD